MKNRLIGILLIFAMLLSLMPVTALAAVKDLAGNSEAENSGILSALSELTGGGSDEAYALLESLGLLDEEGNLDVDQSIDLDGESLTLEEVQALLEDPDTDLSRIASVDGTPIALGDLKTIVQIEQELQRIKETYFSGKAFNQTQLLLLDDLMDQLETEGITATVANSVASGLTLNIVPDASNPAEITYSAYSFASKVTLKYNLTLSGTMPEDGVIGFNWKRICGLMPSDYFNAQLYLTFGSWEKLFISEGYGFSSDPDNPDLAITDISQFSGTLTITINANADSKTLESMLGDNISGVLQGFIEFYDPEGLTITYGGVESDMCSIPVTVSKPNAFEDGTTWQTSMSGASNYDNPMEEDASGYDEKKNPRWNLINLSDTDMVSNYEALENTAGEISGSKPALYKVDARLALYQPDIVPTDYYGYMMQALPVGYSGYAGQTAQALELVRYSWARIRYPDPINFEDITVSESTGELTTSRNGDAPYIRIFPSLDSLNSGITQSVSIIMSASDGHAPYTLNTVWPRNPVFNNTGWSSDNNLTFTTNGKQRTVSSTLSVYDVTAPTLTSVDIPAGTYSTGQYVPITLTFSEPVDASELSININGSVISADDLLMDTTGRKAVAMYQVKAVDDTTINISKVTGLEDLMGNTTAMEDNEGEGWNFEDTVTLESAFMKNAVTAVDASPATVEPTELADGVTVTLTLDQAEAYRTKYAAYNPSEGKAPFKIKLTNQDTGETQTLETALAGGEGDDPIYATATIDNLTPAAADVTYTVEVIAYEDTADTEGSLVAGLSDTFTVKGVTFVNGVSITYPSDDKKELSLADTYRPKLGVSFTGSPTYTTGTWTSSNTAVATINADGQVVLTGTAVGQVSFTFTADDGGLDDPSSGTHTKSATSDIYTVVAGDSPALVIPSAANSIVTRQNSPAEVYWSSNATYFTQADFEFTIELFEGNFTQAQLAGKTAAYTVNAGKTTNSVTIPGEYLTTLSVSGAPAYTVRVSMPHPRLSSEKLSALCYVVVNPEAAAVHLTRPAGGLYLTDDETAEIAWTIGNYTEGSTTGALLIERISTQSGKDVKNTITNQAISAASGSYTLDPETVDGLKDTYMVTLRAQNATDEGYSSDSFPLYVYNAGALKLEVDGGEVESLTMDNEPAVSGALPTATSDILALREELALIEYIGINYDDYKWSQLKDGIKWSTSDTNTVSVNYRQGGLYEDLSRFSMETYLPETKMALSSVTDGAATITATHANTGMSASVEVEVSTLRDKFYLFQLTPMQVTELSYTDGQGVYKTVETNDEGVLALYEPDGIASDVHLKATDGNGSVWLGTIYQNSLVSGERDATRLQLYPLNTFKLRQAAKTEIYLQKPDGSPYTGALTLRGGVYKNDGYCHSAQMLGNTVPDADTPLLDGAQAQTVIIGTDGKLTVYMDSTQFWSQDNGEDDTGGVNLKATDNLQYIFELTGIEGYYPLLVYANGNLTLSNIVRSAESIIVMESYTGSAKPFISNQTMDYGLSGGRLIDVRRSAGHIGPNETYPEAKLLTTVMLWGQDTAQTGYTLQLCDEYGYIPAAQSSELIVYPFSSVPVVRNTLTLSKATITDSGWVAAGKDVGLKTRLSQNNTMLMELPVSPRLVDLTQVPKLTESENVTGMLVDLKSNSGTSGASMSGGDKIVSKLMGLMGDMSGPVNGSNFKMIITPGEDNAVFKAFIWAGYNSLGLDDVDYTESGLFIDTKLAQSQLSVAPSLNDMTDMAKGAYDPNKTMSDAQDAQDAGKATSSVDFGGQLEGYFEAQIQYNFETGKWEIYVLGGGFTVGFGVGVNFNINAQAGPVPLTASFGFGGSVQLDFKAAIRYSEISGYEWATTVTSDSVNDYLTTLRLNVYVSAFGGIGFDYSVVALKIGVFGKLTVDSQNKFLSRTYLADESKRQINGQGVQIAGEIGIKFVAQFLFFSYECVLASVQAGYRWTFNDWQTITEYWANTGSGLSTTALAAAIAGNGLQPVSSSATLQSRAYLERFARTWGTGQEARMSLMSIDTDNALEPLQTNAYPYSLPLVSDDGQLLLYAFDNNSADVSATRIYETALSGGSYPEGSEIAAPAGFDGYGDSGLDLAGDEDFAVSAWVRQSASLNKTAGDTVSAAEQALLVNGTEIVAAVYDGSSWTATRLTANASPDLAPVAATNGEAAIVAWRSVYSGSQEDVLSFTQQDDILYSIYSGGSWSEPRALYNGTSGAVKGIDAAMLADGTGAVAYTLDTDSADGSAGDYEIGYCIVDASGTASFSAIVTQDEWQDENPQLAAVRFDDDDERFVLGWHSLRGGLSDIRLAAIDGGGALSNSFIESITQAAGGSGVNVGGDFRFVKMSGDLNDIENLSLIWPESVDNEEGDTDHSILRGVKFIEDGDNIRISAALDVAELPERTLADHFDAYVSSDDGRTVKAVIQASEYKEIDPDDPDTFTVYQDLDGNDVYVANEEVKLYTATATYENKVRVDALSVDYANLSLNTLTPIQFTIFNAGMDAIGSVEIEIGGSTTTFDDLDLYPNESKTLTYWHSVGGTIENLGYTLTADFGGASDTQTGDVYLDYPDLGISQFKVISEEEGIRTMQLTLYNGSAATLAGGKSRSVHLGFYDDALFESIQAVTCTTPGVTVNSDGTLTIDGEDLLALIDEGALTIEISFDIGRYVTDAGLEEIPDSGIRLYANGWTEETAGSETAVMPEYDDSNNSDCLLFESALARSGRPVSISVEQGLSGAGKTTARVSLHNNALSSRAAGNLIVSLLGSNGNVLEQQQTYDGGSGSLIELDGEQTAVRTFTFSQSGSRVTATYGDLTLGSNSTGLSALSFEGLTVGLSDFTLDGKGSYICTAPDTALSATLVSFVTEDPDATVTINGKASSGSTKVSIPTGASKITVVVTSADGTAAQSYILSVNSTRKQYTTVISEGKYAITVAQTQHGSVTVSHTKAEADTRITVTVAPDEGYELDDLVVTDSKGDKVVLTEKDDGSYTFKMPERSVTVTATFKAVTEEETPETPVTLWANPYIDVTETDWFYEAVRYVSEHSLMNGVGGGRFDPNATTTRAMIVTILYRLAGEPAAAGTNPFADVAVGSWYENAVVWAAENGIVSGYGGGRFGPDDAITREQMAVILYNYAKYKNAAPTGMWAVQLQYPDSGQISDWAMEAAMYCQLKGFIQGDGNGSFNPQGKTRRCEAAAILMRFMEAAK